MDVNNGDWASTLSKIKTEVECLERCGFDPEPEATYDHMIEVLQSPRREVTCPSPQQYYSNRGRPIRSCRIKNGIEELQLPEKPLQKRRKSKVSVRVESNDMAMELGCTHEVDVLESPRMGLEIRPSSPNSRPSSSASTQPPTSPIPTPPTSPLSTPPTESNSLVLFQRTIPIPVSIYNRELFYCDVIEGWPYHGMKTLYDLSNTEVQLELRNRFWHEVKQRTGGLKQIILELGSSMKTIILIINNYGKLRGKQTFLPIAKVTVSTNADQRLDFVFQIEDQERATECFVSSKILKAACEKVFGTIILRCFTERMDACPCNSKYN